MKFQHSHLLNLAAASIVFVAATQPAAAVNRTWVGATTDWITTSNWNPAAAPLTSDALTFNDSGTNTTIVKSTTGAANALSLTFAGSKSYDLGSGVLTSNYLIGSGIYVSSASPLSSTSSGTQSIPYLRLNNSGSVNITFTNNGTGLIKIGTAMRDATGKTGDIVFTGSGDFEVSMLRRNGTDVANGLQKSGAGTLTITGFQTAFTGAGASQRGLYGNVAISGGTIRITSGDQRSLGQPQSPNASWLTLNGGTLQASTIDLAIDNANAGLSLGSSGGTFKVDASRKLTIGGGGETNIISGNGGLTKSGDGSLVLAGTNTYGGATTVSAGTLLVTGALGNTAVTTSADATVGGTGSIAGSLALNGNSFLTIMDTNDPLSVTGSVTFGSGFGIDNLLGLDWDSLTLDTPYTILSTTTSFNTSLIGNFGIDNKAPVGSGDRFAYFQNGSLQLVVIPEPGAVLLGGLGLLALLHRRRH